MSEPIEPNETQPQADDAKALREIVEKTRTGVRREPVKSVVWAFFIGIFLTMFPLGRILGAVTSLAVSLLRPAIVLLGVIKLLDEFSKPRK